MRILLLLSLLVMGCQQPQESTPESKPDPAPLYTYDVESRLDSLGITLSTPPAPVANYVNATRAGNLVFLAGKGPRLEDGTSITGKVPSEVDLPRAYEAARLTGVQLLNALAAEVGDLNKVEQIVEVLGMVNADPDFQDHPKVINGCSDLLVEVFGERGKHARAAVGMGSLPSNIACEIRMTVLIRED